MSGLINICFKLCNIERYSNLFRQVSQIFSPEHFHSLSSWPGLVISGHFLPGTHHESVQTLFRLLSCKASEVRLSKADLSPAIPNFN